MKRLLEVPFLFWTASLSGWTLSDLRLFGRREFPALERLHPPPHEELLQQAVYI